MAKNYVVILDEDTAEGVRAHAPHFGQGYFPRGFHYKKEANELVKEIEEKGGKAHVIPKSQFTITLLRSLNGE